MNIRKINIVCADKICHIGYRVYQILLVGIIVFGIWVARQWYLSLLSLVFGWHANGIWGVCQYNENPNVFTPRSRRQGVRQPGA